MMNTTYIFALRTLKSDLAEAKKNHRLALEKADEEEKRIANLRQSIAAMAQLCGETFEEDDEFGLTDLVRMALKTHGGNLTAPEVKQRLEQLGYPQKSENALASIHTILKRLVLKGETDDGPFKDGKATYRWRPLPPPPKA